jgi:hypothetical protein
MIDEVTSRSNVLDSKAVSIMGWTSALLALFIWQPTWAHTPAVPILDVLAAIGGALGAAVSLAASGVALRIRQWSWPSQDDWLRSDLFGHPSVLKRFHLVSMLETHDDHCNVNARKAHALKVAQMALLCAGGCLVAQLLLRVPIRSLWP